MYKGLFQYNRHLFGVSAPPAVFQKCMHGEPPSRVTYTGISIYLDDILVIGSTIEDNLVKLDHYVLSIIVTAGLKLNKPT